jgi:hypothetical protein
MIGTDSEFLSLALRAKRVSMHAEKSVTQLGLLLNQARIGQSIVN